MLIPLILLVLDPGNTWRVVSFAANVFGTVLLAAVVGMPAYLNGYAAVELLGGLLDQGMAPGAAMSLVIAGTVWQTIARALRKPACGPERTSSFVLKLDIIMPQSVNSP